MKLILRALLLSVLVGLNWACSGGETKTSEPTAEPQVTPPKANLEGNDYLVTISTDYGDMKAVLYDQTPLHKENFIKLAKEGYFDSLLFHRVIQGFMIQGGDPESKNAAPGQPLGGGGPGYRVPAEFVKELYHVKGALSAARTGNPMKESSGSQFYVVQGQVLDRAMLEQQLMYQCVNKMMELEPQNPVCQDIRGALQSGGNAAAEVKITEHQEAIKNTMLFQERLEKYTTVGGAFHLDYDYTVFGKVIDGLEVIDIIAGVETQNDRPVKDVRMYVSVEELPRKKIAEDYNYFF